MIFTCCRFLWPVPLDNDFIAAVFDVGANSTTLVGHSLISLAVELIFG